jgi:hypothetical protein
MIFFPLCLYFFPLRLCNNCSFTDVLGGKYGKREIKIQCFIKLWETWKKMQAIGDIISYFLPYYFNCHTKKCTKIQLGKIYEIFSPSVFIFSLLGHAIIFRLSQTVYWGENIARVKSNHIFPVEHNLFL